MMLWRSNIVHALQFAPDQCAMPRCGLRRDTATLREVFFLPRSDALLDDRRASTYQVERPESLA
jgi:hypothetical protein